MNPLQYLAIALMGCLVTYTYMKYQLDRERALNAVETACRHGISLNKSCLYCEQDPSVTDVILGGDKV